MSSWEVRVKMRGTPLRSLSLVPRERHAGILQSRARNPGTCEQLFSCWSVPKNQRKKKTPIFQRFKTEGENCNKLEACYGVGKAGIDVRQRRHSFTTCAGWASNLTSLKLSFLVY